MTAYRWVDSPEYGGHALRLLEDGVVRVCGPNDFLAIVRPDGPHGVNASVACPMTVMGAAMEMLGR